MADQRRHQDGIDSIVADDRLQHLAIFEVALGGRGDRRLQTPVAQRHRFVRGSEQHQPVAHRGALAQRLQDQVDPAGVGFAVIPAPAPDAAAEIVDQVQLHRLPCARGTACRQSHPPPRQFHIDGLAEARRRVRGDEGLHRSCILRMQPSHGRSRSRHERSALVAETDPARVEHEGVGAQHVAPARLCRPPAEIVLLTITPPEFTGVEHPHLVEAGATDVHAETDCGRQVEVLASVDLRENAVEFTQSDRRKRVLVAEPRITADGRVVGERRRSRDVGTATDTATQPVQPVVGDLGIAVEQHHIAPRVQAHAAVDAGDEAEIARIP